MKKLVLLSLLVTTSFIPSIFTMDNEQQEKNIAFDAQGLAHCINNYDEENALAIIEFLASRDFDFNSPCISNGATLLHYAAQKNSASVIRALKEHGANINALDETGDTPLISAAKTLAHEAIKTLLSYDNLDIDHTNTYGFSAFNYLCITNPLGTQYDSIIATIDHPCFAKDYLTHERLVPLDLIKPFFTHTHDFLFEKQQKAAAKNILRKLLVKNFRITSEHEKVILIGFFGNDAWTTYLNQQGDTVTNNLANLKDIFDKQIAEKKEHQEEKTLKDLGLDIILATQDLNDEAVVLKTLIPLLRKLPQGEKPDFQDSAKNTALHWAAFNDYPQVIKLLLKHEASPNIENKNKQTPYDVAFQKSNTAAMWVMGKDYNTSSSDEKDTPLNHAHVLAAAVTVGAQKSSSSSKPQNGPRNNNNHAQQHNPAQRFGFAMPHQQPDKQSSGQPSLNSHDTTTNQVSLIQAATKKAFIKKTLGATFGVTAFYLAYRWYTDVPTNLTSDELSHNLLIWLEHGYYDYARKLIAQNPDAWETMPEDTQDKILNMLVTLF